jgi:hypothetical protein
MDVYAQITEKIIASQELIIGPIAIEQASHIPNLTLDWKNHDVHITGDGLEVVDQLVDTYKKLFGQISVEVSKEAARPLTRSLSSEQLPQTLK